MTESEIQEFREKLQTKLNTLAPKKIKGITKVDIINVTFEENTWVGYPGNIEIVIHPEFDYADTYNPFDTQWISKIQSFTKNLTTALLHNETRVYVYFR